jgi:carboxypeptidase Q
MKKSVTALMFVSMFFFTFASAQEKVNWDVVNKIIDQGFKKSQVMDIAWNITDGNGPRLTNSKGLERAQKWAMDKLKSWGLKNVRMEEWGTFGKQWDTKKYSVELVQPYYERLIAYPKAWTRGTNGVIEDTITFVDIKSEEDFAKYDGKLKGKIVLAKVIKTVDLRDVPEAQRFTEEELDQMADMMSSGGSRYALPDFLKPYQAEIYSMFFAQRALSRKMGAFMADQGVAAILSIDRRNGRHGTVFSTNGAPRSVDVPDALPEFEMLTEHYLRLVQLKERGKNPVVRLEMENEINRDNPKGYNIIGEIPGKGNLDDEIVMLGAHFDSWHAATGATDNAAGSSTMMEAMRILTEVLQKDKNRNRRTIRIALWTGEEQGLMGSRGYVKKHFAENVKGKWDFKDDYKNISAYYNIDNGGGKIRGVYMEGNAAVHPIFKEWLKPFHAYGAETLTMKPTSGTDHMAFDAVGIPGFQFIQDPLEYRTRTHHTNMDNFYRLQDADMKQISTIVATFVYHTATRKQILPRKPLPQPRRSRF